MNVSKKITQILVEEHVVTIDNYELYEYSINAVLEMGGNILASLLLGILLERFAETALFLLVIIPLRSYIGGWHAKRTRNCFIISMLIYLASIYLPQVLCNMNMILCTSLFLLELLYVCLVAPIDCLEKPLSESQKKEMKVVVRWILAFAGLLYIILFWLGFNQLCLEMFVIMLYACTSLLAEAKRKIRAAEEM